MFDDQNEPKDIFADVEPAPKPKAPENMNQVRPPSTTDLGLEDAKVGKGSSRLAIVAIIIVVLVVALLATLGTLWYIRQGQDPASDAQPAADQNIQQQVDVQPQESDSTADPIPEEDEVILNQESTPEPEPVDTDGDGLTDLDEEVLGTNPNLIDTDADGLNDGDEAIYQANPLNPDTDGDGFLDGEEVAGGYDPALGDGALLN